MNGPDSSQFVKDYGFTVSLYKFPGQANTNQVTCMSCHDQHSMNAYNGTIGNVQGHLSDDVLRQGLLQSG